MASLHTEYPSKVIGELNFARQVAAFDDSQLHLWFALGYIPGVRDIDCVIWHEMVGVFIVEIKAVSLPMVEEFGLVTCRIRGRETEEPPQHQAYMGQECLLRYLRPKMIRPPFFVSTVCWPLISRSDWKRAWDNEYIRGEHAEMMIFEDDIAAGPERLKKRLEHIRYNPPIRKGADRPFYHRKDTLEEFQRALTITARREVAPSDLQKLRIIEENVARETIKQVPAGKANRVLYYGHPGTGKTFRLLQVGMHHALAGHRVLFACFNKVLAADIRRILSHSARLMESTGDLLPVDVFDMLRTYAEEHRIKDVENDYDVWGALITEHMRETAGALEKYNTILIDEGQDMKDWALEMLELHAKDDTTICVAAGTGQELYGKSGSWLDSFRGRSTPRELRRNFRNTKPVFQAAQVFYEARLNPGKIASTVRRFTEKKSKGEQHSFLFERDEGNPPSIMYISEDKLEGMQETDPFYPIVQNECMVEEYARIIRNQLDRLEGNERPMDLLVLVPGVEGMERTWAGAALKSIGASYIDYTEEDQRRDIAHPEMVRLCTFHSARGLEGMRVVIFGFERIERVADQVEADFANLGYIVLSRSLFECVLGSV